MPDEPGAYATRDGIKLWYRDEGNPDGPPLLLIMGLSSQLIHWPDDFVADLGSRGYRVIRFDNRDSGLSDKFPGRLPAFEPPLLPGKLPWSGIYRLGDMADDAVGVLEFVLGPDEPAHIVGASMGGMIAQLVAIHHKRKVLSLCSIMSTTGALDVGRPTPEAYDAVTAPTPTERTKAIEHITWVTTVIGSKTYEESERPARLALAEKAFDRAFCPECGKRQSDAILLAGNRTLNLRQVTVPSLVVHGAEDSLIDISGGRATYDALKVKADATWLPFDTMGHDLPQPLRGQIAEAIDTNAKKAG
jgi:pimeloyl-ACP methyl ester carboxylesterase